MVKKYFRCFVCGDIHYGNSAPDKCPTCFIYNAYCEIDSDEAINLVSETEEIKGLDKERDKEKIKSCWEEFCQKNDFKLSPDLQIIDNVAIGICLNEKDYGLKLCPCRLRDGSRNRDKELICPCNFKSQNMWKKESRCWCGLFVKR